MTGLTLGQADQWARQVPAFAAASDAAVIGFARADRDLLALGQQVTPALHTAELLAVAGRWLEFR